MGKFRNVKIAKIKIAQSQLSMSEDAYRAMLSRITNKDSCALMTDAQLDSVIAEMKRLGFVPKKASTVAPIRPRVDLAPLISKVNALLADSGRPAEYANAMAKHMFKKDRVEWLDARQLHSLVAALQIDANRRAKND